MASWKHLRSTYESAGGGMKVYETCIMASIVIIEMTLSCLNHSIFFIGLSKHCSCFTQVLFCNFENLRLIFTKINVNNPQKVYQFLAVLMYCICMFVSWNDFFVKCAKDIKRYVWKFGCLYQEPICTCRAYGLLLVRISGTACMIFLQIPCVYKSDLVISCIRTYILCGGAFEHGYLDREFWLKSLNSPKCICVRLQTLVFDCFKNSFWTPSSLCLCIYCGLFSFQNLRE